MAIRSCRRFLHPLGSFRRADFPQYGWQPAWSSCALPQMSPAAFHVGPAVLAVAGPESRRLEPRLCPHVLGTVPAHWLQPSVHPDLRRPLAPLPPFLLRPSSVLPPSFLRCSFEMQSEEGRRKNGGTTELLWRRPGEHATRMVSNHRSEFHLRGAGLRNRRKPSTKLGLGVSSSSTCPPMYAS